MEARIKYGLQASVIGVILGIYLILVMFEQNVHLSPPEPLKDTFLNTSQGDMKQVF